MIKSHSILEETALQSVIRSESYIKPEGGKDKRSLFADLLLTALIDAFSILVIFLLMSFSSTGEILFMSKDMELPKSGQAVTLERNTVVKVEEDKFYLEDKELTLESLLGELVAMSKQLRESNPQVADYEPILTIQADRRIHYKQLNNLVLAAAQAGFSDIRFAVVMK